MQDVYRVDIFVDFKPASTGLGFAVSVAFQAFAYRFTGSVPDGAGGEKENWENMHVEQFEDCAQNIVQARVAQGLDPLFELFKENDILRSKLQTRFAALAAIYEEMELDASTPRSNASENVNVRV